MKRYLPVKGQSYIVDKVKTPSRRDLLRLDVFSILMRGNIKIKRTSYLHASHPTVPQAVYCFCLKFGAFYCCTNEIQHDFINKYLSSDMVFEICCRTVFP